MCGYGLVGDKYRPSWQMRALKEYYTKTAEVIEAFIRSQLKLQPNQKFSVVFTGGFTNSYYYDVSESCTARSYFKDCIVTKLPLLNYYYLQGRLELLIEEESTKTYENLIEATKIKSFENYVYIIGSKTRCLKLKAISAVYFRQYDVVGINHSVLDYKDKNPLIQLMRFIKPFLSKNFYKRQNEIPFHHRGSIVLELNNGSVNFK